MIAIVKYNAGNVQSVQNAIERLGYSTIVTDDTKVLTSADKVVFPGVGEASSAMRYLQEKGLAQTIIELKQPVLGICLGMQLLCKYSEEGDVRGLGIFENEVKLFPPNDIVPHMGWNNLKQVTGPLFEGINESDDFYFVHSYYATLGTDTIAVNDYILPFSVALNKANYYAVQFHPEKSGKVGEAVLKNFLSL